MGNIVQLPFLESAVRQNKEVTNGLAEAALRAAEKGDVQALCALLSDSTVNPLTVACPKTHTTPLHAASAAGQLGAVEFLLTSGASANVKDGSGETALHVAVARDRMECASLLLSFKADLTIRNRWARTPLLTAIVHCGNACASLLLQTRADPNVQDDYGLSPAHIAASYSDIALLTELVSYGADINLQNAKYRTPLMVAINASHLDMVDHLVKLGAKTYVSDKQESVSNALEEAFHLMQMQFMHKLHCSDALASSVRIFRMIACAHGHPVSPKTFVSWMEVFLRCVIPDHLFSALLLQLSVLAGVASVAALPRLPAPPAQRQLFRSQMCRYLPEQYTVMSLQNLARGIVRKELLRYGENVVSASNRLDIPPALISIIQMQDM